MCLEGPSRYLSPLGHYIHRHQYLPWQDLYHGYQTNDSILVSPCIADLNLDGKLEIVICTDNGTIHCSDLQGTNQSGIISWWGEVGTPFRTNNIDGNGDY